MNKLMFKVGGALATGAIIASGFAGAAFADSSITGNGVGSINTINNSSVCYATVVQTNDSYIKTDVNQSANTGGNTANSNTGGNVSITTGDVNQSATVTVDGSSNTATAPSCCGCQEITVGGTIDGNGVGSINAVNNSTVKVTSSVQTNKSKIKTTVRQKAKTGKNNSNSNTGGTVGVTTGGATQDATVGVTGSTNTL
jgi:hypothetical protein